MQTHFDFLPDEINLQFLERVGNYSDTLKACSNPIFSRLCDWNFWRKKAENEFNVPKWYFDLSLTQNRQISASDRYLEVISKFWLIPESIARFEDGKVKGVYFPHQARVIAARQGNLEIYSLAGGENSDEIARIEERIRFKNIGLPILFDSLLFRQRFGQNLASLFKLRRSNALEIERVIQSAENMLILLSERNFSRIETLLENKTSILDLAVLAASGDEEIFPIVEKFFLLENEEDKATILNFSIGSRKPEQFIRLFSLTPSIHQERQEGLIVSAYFFAEQTIIEFLEKIPKIGQLINIGYKLSSLYEGYLTEPRPVETYQIIQNKLKSETDEESFMKEIRKFVKIDTDIFFLVGFQQQDLKDFIQGRVQGEPNYPVAVVEYAIEGLKRNHYNFLPEYRTSGRILRILFDNYQVTISFDRESFFQKSGEKSMFGERTVLPPIPDQMSDVKLHIENLIKQGRITPEQLRTFEKYPFIFSFQS